MHSEEFGGLRFEPSPPHNLEDRWSLMFAVRNSNLDGLKQLLEDHVKSTGVQCKPQTGVINNPPVQYAVAFALQEAIKTNQKEALQVLLKARDGPDDVLLKMALLLHYTLDIIESLVALGCNPNIHLAYVSSHAEVLYLRQGAEIRKRMTYIHLAVHYEQPEILLLLLQAPGGKSLVDATDDEWMTPLHLAVKTDHLGMINTLLEAGANPLAFNESILPAFVDEEASELEELSEGRRHVFSCICDNKTCLYGGSIWGETYPIHVISAYNLPLMFLKSILDKGASVNVRDADGDTPLMLALDKRLKKNVTLLLGHPDIQVNNADLGYTALHLAVENDQLNLVELLVRAGADINQRIKAPTFPPAVDWPDFMKRRGFKYVKGFTPLEQAVWKDSYEVVKYLLEQPGIRVDDRDPCGNSAITQCMKTGNVKICQLLLEAGADVHQSTSSEYEPLLMIAAGNTNPDVVQYLLRVPGVKVDATDSRGRTALMEAVQHTCRRCSPCRNRRVLTLLLEAGAEVNHRDNEGWTPAMVCSRYSPTLAPTTLSIIEVLAQYGGDLNVVAEDGSNLLSFWARWFYLDRLEVAEYHVKQLVNGLVAKHNVDLRISRLADSWGRTPIDYVLEGAKRHPWRLSLAGFLVRLGFSLEKTSNLHQLDILESNSQARFWFLWLRSKAESPRTLIELCRFGVLGTLGHINVKDKIEQLPLPQLLRKFLTLQGILEWSQTVGRSPLDTDWDSLISQDDYSVISND